MIDDYAFGRIIINGQQYSNDLRIIQGIVVPEWWRISGHLVEPDDVTDIMGSNPDIIILGKGSPGMMQSSESLKNLLKSRNILLHELPTKEAVSLFNTLSRESKNIAAGFHLTC